MKSEYRNWLVDRIKYYENLPYGDIAYSEQLVSLRECLEKFDEEVFNEEYNISKRIKYK